ncbi:MAG: hydroxyacid dehydrogenase [Opitutaceae bacterium]|jgi:phosphoglycerate dehydrogenase-like enzyme
MNPLAETCLDTPSVLPSPERILFALSTRELDIFLPGLRLEEFAGRTYSYVNTDAMDADGKERVLREWKPTVLMTAWSAPRIPSEWVESADMPLRYICHVTGSVRSFVPRVLIERGVRVTNWGQSINHTVAEHAMLMVLALLRGASGWPAAMAQDGWTIEQTKRLRTLSLRGRRVGLHGFGGVAREIVAMMAPFRPGRVCAYSQGVPAAFIEAHGVNACGSLEELFAGSDVLVECESLTAASRASVDGNALGLLPDDAVFVNVGRGSLVVEAALLKEAASGRLRVGLDVFHREPLAADSPLRTAPGVMLSPHIAGPTSETYRLCGDHALDNLRRYLEGKPLSGEITPEAFDRMT